MPGRVDRLFTCRVYTDNPITEGLDLSGKVLGTGGDNDETPILDIIGRWMLAPESVGHRLAGALPRLVASQVKNA